MALSSQPWKIKIKDKKSLFKWSFESKKNNSRYNLVWFENVKFYDGKKTQY